MKKIIILGMITATMALSSISAFAAADTTTGWVQNGTTKNYKVNGQIVTNGIVQDQGKTYYIDAQGNPQNGFLTKNGATAYFKDGLLQTGWQYINNAWYYFGEFGAMASNTTIDGYKIDSNGQYYK